MDINFLTKAPFGWVKNIFRVKIFSGAKYIFSLGKYFRERKIFSSVWLHFKNYIIKQFSVFGNILKMLFSYKFFTLSQPFSHLPNKFYFRKSPPPTHQHPQKIHHFTKPTTTQHKNHQNATTHTTTTTTTTKLEIKEIKQISERVIDERVIGNQANRWGEVRWSRSCVDRRWGEVRWGDVGAV